MNWKAKLAIVIDATLNDIDGESIYNTNVIDDNSFEILKHGERILITECVEYHLPSNWRKYARVAVLRLREDEFNKQLLLLEK